MAQVQSEQTILREVLRIIATTPEPVDVIPPVLEIMLDVIGARSVGILLFEEPHLLLSAGVDIDNFPEDEQIREIVVDLPHSVDVVTGFDGWVFGQIKLKGEIVGALFLIFDDAVRLTDEVVDLVVMFINSLTTVISNLRMIARHEKLGRNQSEFMRIVSHDLRSPLTSMQGFASMLESGMVGELNEKQSHFVEKILSGIAQMTSLVENIQDAGRFDPETGFYEMQRTQCDLTEMVHRIMSNHLLPGEKQELTIKASIADDIPIIFADANMLERAITNLVDNAIKYTPNGREIEIGVKRHEEKLIVSVKDNGLGISPDHQKLLFERHVRIPRQEHKRVKGSGLGLFIVRSVARRHGGNAWVVSEEGSGSTFFISIPLNADNALVSG